MTAVDNLDVSHKTCDTTGAPEQRIVTIWYVTLILCDCVPQMRLNSTALGHIKLGDQRAASDHVEDLQRSLSDNIRVTAVGRKASVKKFVGTFINDPCKGNLLASIELHSLYWSIHTKDESKRGTAFAFIFGVN